MAEVESNSYPLVPDSELKTFGTIKEAKDYLVSQNRVNTYVDNMGNLKFTHNKEGKLLIDYGIGEVPFSDTGFKQFCKVLQVPDKFVSSLPTDNCNKDLYASVLRMTVPNLNFIKKNDVVVGCSSKKNPLSSLEVLEAVFPGNSSYNIREVTFANEKAYISFTGDNFSPFKNNDFIQGGLHIEHDDSSGNIPLLQYYFWRTICSNGAIAKNFTKIARFSGKMEKEDLLKVLDERINQNLDMVNSNLEISLNKMNETAIPHDDKKYLKAFLSRKLDYKNMDVLETNFNEQIGKENSTYYDLMNYITDSAKSFDVHTRNKLLVLGGDMVSHFKDTRPTLDVLKGFHEYKRKSVYKETVEV